MYFFVSTKFLVKKYLESLLNGILFNRSHQYKQLE